MLKINVPNIRKDIVYASLFVIISVFLVWFSRTNITKIAELRESSNDMITQTLTLEQGASEKLRQIEIYKKYLYGLEKYKLKIPESDVDFYNWVQRELNRNNMKSTAMRPDAKTANMIQVDLHGPYYSFVKTLADWRNLGVVIKLNSVILNGSEDENVTGVVVLESVSK